MSVMCEVQLVADPEAADSAVLNHKTGALDMEFDFDEDSGMNVEVSPDAKHVDLILSGEGFRMRFRMAPGDARKFAAELHDFASEEGED